MALPALQAEDIARKVQRADLPAPVTQDPHVAHGAGQDLVDETHLLLLGEDFVVAREEGGTAGRGQAPRELGDAMAGLALRRVFILNLQNMHDRFPYDGAPWVSACASSRNS